MAVSQVAKDLLNRYIDIGKTLVEWYSLRHNWSQATFGSSEFRSSIGPLKHLRKEVEECIAETDRAKRLVEYADCLHLIFDAADRDGFSLEDVLTACEEKLKINMGRVWPKGSSDSPVEHKRDE